MKAAILVKQNSPLVVTDIEIPPLDVGQVLVKVEYSGICGKQLEELSGRRGPDPFLPHLLGHEGAGIVEKVGPGVKKVAPGDHVVLHWMKGSGIDSSPPRFNLQGKVVSAGWVTTFSERTIVSENRITQIDPGIPLDVASLMGCAVTTGLGIVFNDAALKPGQSIAIFGVGGIGLNVIQGAGLVNAHPIVAIDIHDSKLEEASSFGATHTFNSKNRDANKFLLEISGGNGFDVIVDVTGNAAVRQVAYDSTSNTGITIFAGVPGYKDRISIDSFPLHFGRRLKGSHGGDTWPDMDIPKYLQLYKLGKLKLDEQISHRYPLAKINDAFDIAKKGQASRCLITILG